MGKVNIPGIKLWMKHLIMFKTRQYKFKYFVYSMLNKYKFLGRKIFRGNISEIPHNVNRRLYIDNKLNTDYFSVDKNILDNNKYI